MKLKVRRLQPSDLGGLARLLRDFFAEQKIEYPVMDNEEIEKQLLFIVSTLNDPRVLYLVALDGKKLIGWFFGEIITRAFGKPHTVGVARELYVVPSKRGRGVAKKLMDIAIRYAYQSGAEAIEQLGVPEKTQPRWEKLGFRPYVVNGWMAFSTANKFTEVEKK
jgi:GNAT superfamily N-acetyltransferase